MKNCMNHTHLRHKVLFTLLPSLLGLGIMAPASCFADDDFGHSRIEFAQVTRVEPITRPLERRVPVEECWTETVRYDTPPRDDYESLTGTLIGGVIGGALGNAVGHKKKNKQVGTAVGAVLGASIGHDLTRGGSHYQERGEGYYQDERRCETHYQTQYEEKVIGYNVWYRYRDNNYSTRMDHDPGQKIRVRVTVSPL